MQAGPLWASLGWQDFQHPFPDIFQITRQHFPSVLQDPGELCLPCYLSREFLASFEWQVDEAILIRHADFKNLSLEANAR